MATEPAFDRIQAHLLPIADAFMGLMLSRPGGLSLRTTRVTIVTIWLSSGTAVFSVAAGLAVVSAALRGHVWLLLVGAVAAAGMAFGSGCLALYGIRQRWVIRS
jgi:hypothetical protein